MTLEKRLQKRLQRWLQEARKRRLTQSEGTEPHDDEWWLNQSALEMLEKLINELTADLCAVSEPEPRT